MRILLAAAFALVGSTSLAAQAIADLAAATPVEGSWIYAATPEGSEASFQGPAGSAQLWVHCTRSTRRVTIAKAAAAAAPMINIWTSSLSRSVPSTFLPATRRLSAELANYDPLLDAIANSRGRIGFSAGSEPPLVLPAWGEVAHVIEDCRA